MHEMSIAESILKISLQEAQGHGAKKIKVIRIKMGVLKELIPYCIDYYFQIISKGSIAEDARLVIDRLPLVISCRECGISSEMDCIKYSCPLCGSQNLDIIQGREFYIESLEVD